MALLRAEMRRAVGRRLRAAGRLEIASAVSLSVAVALLAALYSPSAETSTAPAVAEAVVEPLTPEPTPGTAAQAVDAVEASEEAAVDIPEQDGPLGPTMPTRMDRHQVQRGETLASIASSEDTTIDDLVTWNEHVEADSVLIHGEWLVIPRWEDPSVAEEIAVDGEDEGTRGRGGG